MMADEHPATASPHEDHGAGTNAERQDAWAAACPPTPVEEDYSRVAREILRRDGNAEWREWRAYRIAAGLICLVAVLVVVCVVLAIRGSRVDVVVQVVQHDEEGHMVKIGVPVDLLAYTPQDGAWRTLLETWVSKQHWRGDETSDVRARYDWRWLYLHACGAARKQLDDAVAREKPFTPSPKRTQIDVDTITKTITPESYQVNWKATTVTQYHPHPDTTHWTTTFTVGRARPKTLADANLNHLGLCVTWFDDEKRH